MIAIIVVQSRVGRAGPTSSPESMARTDAGPVAEEVSPALLMAA
jgi:hypothetical protein